MAGMLAKSIVGTVVGAASSAFGKRAEVKQAKVALKVAKIESETKIEVARGDNAKELASQEFEIRKLQIQ